MNCIYTSIKRSISLVFFNLILFAAIGLFNPIYAADSLDLPKDTRSWNPQQVETYIRRVFADTGQAEIIVATFKAESGLRCNAVGAGQYLGIAQVSHYWWGKWFGGWYALLDCKNNIDASRVIYNRGGLRPWGAYTNGAYLKFMPK
jgi:hypothetical protein